MALDWRRWGGALLAGCVTALIALEVPVRLPEGDATPDPANLLTEELPEVAPEDLGAFMASRRWGTSLNEIREVRVTEAEPVEPALNPVLVKMGYVGLIVAGDQSAVLLALPDGGITRMVPGDTLPDGRTLVSVTDNSLTLQGDGRPEEVLMLFPRFRTGTKDWSGGSGDDMFESGPDADSFDGGAGSDTVSYAQSVSGVRVKLGPDGEGRFGHAAGDVLIDIENIIGSAHDDTLYGDSSDNRLSGGDGDDRIYAGRGDDILEGGDGADQLTGGYGEDTVSYAGSDAAVIVNLAAGTGRFGHAEGDTLHRSEGNSIEHGGSGADRLDGGEGADELLGGAGSDTFIFASGHGDDVIADFTDGEDLIDLTGLGIASFSDLAVSTDPRGVMIDLAAHGGGTILLERFDPADLDASDFQLP